MIYCIVTYGYIYNYMLFTNYNYMNPGNVEDAIAARLSHQWLSAIWH